jgi:hypothetical protein
MAEDDIWAGMTTPGSREFDLHHWNGTAWSRQTLPDQQSASANRVVVQAWSDQVIFAIGSCTGSGYWRLWKTTNGGTSWSTLDTGTLELNYARPVTMLVTGSDEVYMCGASGILSPGLVALWRWNGSMAREVIGNLPRTDPTYGYHYHYSGLAWNRSDNSEIWIINVGSVTDSDAARLRKGVFGSSWVVQHQLDSGAGYSHDFYTATDRVMTMDDNGKMGIVAFGSGNYRVLFGDPTDPPLSEVSGITANAGVGEKASYDGYFVMTDNGDGYWYNPDTESWAVPDNTTWGSGKGAFVLDMPDPTGFEPLTGGLREIHSDTIGTNEPLWISRMLAHNQELINDTFLPRHLFNDWYVTQYVAAHEDGSLVGQWGRFARLPDMEVKVRINVSVDEAYEVMIYVLATPVLITDPWKDADGNRWLVSRYGTSDQYDYQTLAASASRQWYTFTVQPPPLGQWWYLSVWFQGETGSTEVDTKPYIISAVERRRIESA